MTDKKSPPPPPPRPLHESIEFGDGGRGAVYFSPPLLHHHAQNKALSATMAHMMTAEMPEVPSTEDAQTDAIWGDRCGVLHKAWVQVRYHRHRQRFFDLADPV